MPKGKEDTSMIRIALVEDDRAYREELIRFLKRYEEESGEKIHITTFTDGDEIVEGYSCQFDIILMDIVMKYMNGMDAAELKLVQPHVVRLEARPPNVEGKGAVTIRDLVKNCLRMRPDRIIVGECRSGEALDMLQAMNTGHDGSLTTVHANSPRDVISRLETMVMMSGMELPSKAIREQIASAVDIIIHESRLSDGSRKVDAITEVTGLEGSQIVMQDIFTFNQTGVGDNGKIIGEFRPTGAIPTWLDQLSGRGITVDTRMFDPSYEGNVNVIYKS